MDLKDFLTHAVVSLRKEEIGTIIGPDPEQFNALFELAFSREMPVCWRATWIMDYLSELHPWLAIPHIEKIWQEIPEQHPDGVTRSALRLLSRHKIPEDFQGIAADLCLSWLEQESVPVAIKAYSMEVLLKIATAYPEFTNEFITVIETQAPHNSAGFKARSHHITRAMKQL
ncbi:MAG: hypothetical protein P1P82_12850 [Bacteroidales bacterium]|nr:hypothetical protein [Bacteroidales bacterium]MDT8432393.1 hypothetical protein [Bacteroidales bacterium]